MVEEKFWTATDLKDFSVCPRLTWFSRLKNLHEPDTVMMDAGSLEHKSHAEKEDRRRYEGKSLKTKRKITDVYVCSKRVGFHGIIDSVVLNHDGDIIIERKYSQSRKSTEKSGRVQAGLYAILWEDMYPDRCVEELWIAIGKEMIEVQWNDDAKRKIEHLLLEFAMVMGDERVPPEIKKSKLCESCWYSRFCWGE